MTTTVECWSGLVADHLYENCPSRVRCEASMRRYGMWFRCAGRVDPFGGDICGLCVSRYTRACAPTGETE